MNCMGIRVPNFDRCRDSWSHSPATSWPFPGLWGPWMTTNNRMGMSWQHPLEPRKKKGVPSLSIESWLFNSGILIMGRVFNMLQPYPKDQGFARSYGLWDESTIKSSDNLRLVQHTPKRNIPPDPNQEFMFRNSPKSFGGETGGVCPGGVCWTRS